MTKPPVLTEIVRQHAEMAAFLWTLYDHHMLHPEENPEMDEERLARLVERLEAHLFGLRVAREEGRRIAAERLEEYPDPGELFVVRMLATEQRIPILELNLAQVRAYIAANISDNVTR